MDEILRLAIVLLLIVASQAVRAEGVNRTALTRTRDGSSPWMMGSTAMKLIMICSSWPR